MTDKELKKANAEIESLQAENERLKSGYKNDKSLTDYFSDLVKQQKDTIDKQEAEIERLKPFENKIAGFNSHIRVEDMLVFANSLEEWLEFCENLKAEAYKECIDLVKKKGVKVGVDEICIFTNTLDNLLKELVGE